MPLKVVAISDTHNQHEKLTIPKCDVLIHAGDFTGSGTISETKAFVNWFSKQPAKDKVFISGNHDALDQEFSPLFKSIVSEYPSVTYLRDEMAIIQGLKIYGYPWTPRFFDWNWMADPESPLMLSTLKAIPEDLDILISHGPPKGLLDKTERGESVGSSDLLLELDRIKPRYLICGHIHHSCGILEQNGMTIVNAAILNDHYQYKNQPIILDIP
jgi:Icc-related predicted phosphoesterase